MDIVFDSYRDDPQEAKTEAGSPFRIGAVSMVQARVCAVRQLNIKTNNFHDTSSIFPCHVIFLFAFQNIFLSEGFNI